LLAFDLLNCTALNWLYVRTNGLAVWLIQIHHGDQGWCGQRLAPHAPR
jgi:hypothetical protein